MASDRAKRDATRWMWLWMDAAVDVAVLIKPPDIDEDGIYRDSTAHLLLFTVAARDMLRSASVVLSEEHPVIKEFWKRCPGLKDLRDVLEHHDEYLQGKGRLRAKITQPRLQTVTYGWGGSHCLQVIIGSSKDSPAEEGTATNAAATSFTVDLKKTVTQLILVAEAAGDTYRQLQRQDASRRGEPLPEGQPHALAKARAFAHPE